MQHGHTGVDGHLGGAHGERPDIEPYMAFTHDGAAIVTTQCVGIWRGRPENRIWTYRDAGVGISWKPVTCHGWPKTAADRLS